MLRISSALATVFLLSACLGPSRAPGRVASTFVAGAGFLLIENGASRNCSIDGLIDSAGCQVAAQFETVVGTTVLAIAISALLYNELRTPPAESVESAPFRVAVPERRYVPNAAEIREPTTSDPMLRQLTLQASLAARAGHCGVVRAVAVRLDELNPGYRRGGFMTDRAIVACIDR